LPLFSVLVAFEVVLTLSALCLTRTILNCSDSAEKCTRENYTLTNSYC